MIKTVNLIVSIGRDFLVIIQKQKIGQYKIPRKYRMCKLCLLQVNEEHLFLDCKINKTALDNLFGNYLPSHNNVSYPRTKSKRNA